MRTPGRRRRVALYVSRRERLRLRRVLRSEMIAGVFVMAAAALGFALANSPAVGWYVSLRDARIGPASLHLDLTVGQWASDGLLAIFFFLVGLELKREFVEGALSRLSSAIVPVVAAFGGVITPAVIYLAINAGGEAMHGWAIPTATDIAFAVAVLGLIAPGVPLALRIFLLTLAVVDDFIAIGIIAIFYTNGIDLAALLASLALVLLYAVLVRLFAPWYATRKWAAWLTLLPIGVVAWAFMHASGVHATIAGVLLAFTVPVSILPRERGDAPRASRSVHLAEQFNTRFTPLSTGIAVPVFAFFAAGVSVTGARGFASEPLAIGIVLGLVLGKPLGITVFTLLLTKLTRAQFDSRVGLRQLIGVGALGGIGFTVALLVAELSFDEAAQADIARLAVLAGSAISVVVAAFFLVRRRGARP